MTEPDISINKSPDKSDNVIEFEYMNTHSSLYNSRKSMNRSIDNSKLGFYPDY